MFQFQVTSEVEDRLSRFTSETGCSQHDVDALVNDAILAQLDELTTARKMLNRRYDELVSGQVEAIPAPQAFAQLREEFKAERARRGA